MAIAILGLRDFECGHSMVSSADTVSGSPNAGTGQAHTGTYALRMNTSGAGEARWAISGTPSNPSVSVWIYPASYTTADSIKLKLLVQSGEYIELRWNATSYTFDAYVDGVLAAAGTVQVPNIGWFSVQWYTTLADAGTLQVKIDGRLSIDYSGDTKPSTSAAVTYLHIYSQSATNYFDDLVWGTGGYLGALRVNAIRPTANSAVAWTPSAGTNYECVDETPYRDSDYNYTAVNATVDELTLGDFDSADKVLVAVDAWVRAWEVEADATSLKVGVDSGGTDATTTHALSTTATYYHHCMDTDPATGVEWIDAGVDALLLYYEAVV